MPVFAMHRPSCELTAKQHDQFVSWLSHKFKEERQILECRHEALIRELLRAGHPRPCCSSEASSSECLPRINPLPLPPLREPSCLSVNPKAALPPASNEDDESPRQSVALRRLSTQDDTIRGMIRETSLVNFVLPKDMSGLRTGVFERFVLSPAFESIFAVLIVVNTLIMAAEVQHSGIQVGQRMDYYADSADPDSSQDWAGAAMFFRISEIVFGSAFTLEITMKAWIRGWKFFHTSWNSRWNMFDTLIVVAWLTSELVENLGRDIVDIGPSPTLLRVCRLVRLIRLLRLLKTALSCDIPVLMVTTIQESASVLLWSVVILSAVMTLCAFLLNSSLEPYMLDGNNPLDIRLELFWHFGTYTRCMVTMCEITLANWVGVCRLLAEHVDEGWAAFIILYKCVVGFAVLQVIMGVFMHETFRCAGLNDDLMISQRRRMRNRFQVKMGKFFDEADLDKSTDVSLEEFEAMIADDSVNTWLEAMDIRVRDVGASRIFAFLAGPDMELSRDELITGMSRLRGPAQGLDIVTLLELSAPDLQLPAPRDVQRFRCPSQVPADPARVPRVRAEPLAEGPPKRCVRFSASPSRLEAAAKEVGRKRWGI